MPKRTPLFEVHRNLGAKMIDFGGWEMPVQYTSIMDEHQAVRAAAGMFDISHMGEVLVTGTAAEVFLNAMLTNDVRKLVTGHGQYSLMCNEGGGVIDDLYVYRIAASEFLLIVNASRTDMDVAWLHQQLATYSHHSFVGLHDLSSQTAALAVQGPRVVEFIDKCFSGGSTGGSVVSKATALKKNQIAQFQFAGHPAWVGRTGYTGEDGFEVVAPADTIQTVWTTLMNAGASHGLRPAGLGARDTLRTEVCYPLYGQDLNEQTSPIEAGLGFFVAFDKGDFNGRTVMIQQKQRGVARKLVAFKMNDRCAPPRPHYPIMTSGEPAVQIGEVSSGTQSPSLGIGIGLGYVKTEFAKPQMPVTIEIRGQRANAVVTPKPLYRKPV